MFSFGCNFGSNTLITASGGVETPPSFRSVSNTTYASRTNTTITAPAGIQDDDILLAFVSLGGGSDPSDPSAIPSGFTELATSPIQVNKFGFYLDFHCYWKRASSEAGDYTFSHPALSSQGVMLAYSGCITTGSPVDLYSINSGEGTTTTASGITTTEANTMLITAGVDFADTSNDLTPPTGMTERLDVTLTYVADVTQSSAGASGDKTFTNNSGATSPWGAYLIALKGI